MIFHENHLLMIYHTLFFSKIGKDVSKFASAAVVIGTLRVNLSNIVPDYISCMKNFIS